MSACACIHSACVVGLFASGVQVWTCRVSAVVQRTKTVGLPVFTTLEAFVGAALDALVGATHDAPLGATVCATVKAVVPHAARHTPTDAAAQYKYQGCGSKMGSSQHEPCVSVPGSLLGAKALVWFLQGIIACARAQCHTTHMQRRTSLLHEGSCRAAERPAQVQPYLTVLGQSLTVLQYQSYLLFFQEVFLQT